MGIFSFRDDFRISSQTPNNPAVADSGVIRGLVKKVYLDFSTQPNGASIKPGTIEIQALGRNMSTTIFAYPQNELFLDLPLVNEYVDVFLYGTLPTYRRLNLNDTINNADTPANEKETTPAAGVSNFKSLNGFLGKLASLAGNLGDYFVKKPIHRLKLYEGDTMIQSKFGQSIRLSGYNNGKNNFNPKLTIRNGEAKKFESIALSSTIEEDLNRDGSTILLSSGDSINFIPGTPDLLGGSNFKNRPDKSARFVYVGKDDDYGFEAYPKVYDGEQCIITSDRLVFSSRKNETIFWSKGNYGIITDGIFTVDAERGININTKMPIDIQSFNNQINLFIGDVGEINLGNKNLKPAVDGLLLVEILSELIAEILNLRNAGLLTPSGPTSGMNPDLINKFEAIAGKLKSLCSERVKVQM